MAKKKSSKKKKNYNKKIDYKNKNRVINNTNKLSEGKIEDNKSVNKDKKEEHKDFEEIKVEENKNLEEKQTEKDDALENDYNKLKDKINKKKNYKKDNIKKPDFKKLEELDNEKTRQILLDSIACNDKVESDYTSVKGNNRKINKKLIFLIVLLIVLVYIFIPHISLKGKRYMILNYLEKYSEPGFSARILNKDITKYVSVSGRVDSRVLKTYRIKYTLKYKKFKFVKTRIVKVDDISNPKIMLNGVKNTYVCPNNNYKEEGYRAYDNYDKDITKLVKVDKNKDYYKYSVRDKRGNKSEIIRKLIYKDNVKPVISVKNNIYLSVGDELKKEYSAFDNCDNDISKKVRISGKADLEKPGEYVFKYKVYDKARNYDEVIQKVHVSKKDDPGTIYLTFDDGPNSGTTDVILDILKEEGVVATFFVTNNGSDELIKREYDEGHTVAIHTASHNYSYVYSSVDNYYQDLKSVQDRIFRLTGTRSMLFRFPGGSSNTVSRRYQSGIMTILTERLINDGYKYYDWNLNSGDADICHDKDCVYKEVTSRLNHDGVNMVLMHDIKPYTRDALRDIIKYAKENGYTFSRIDESTQMIKQHVNN